MTSCEFTDDCKGFILCIVCDKSITECECEDESSGYYCTRCYHKKCFWCACTTLFPRTLSADEDCDECKDWIKPGDDCKMRFCMDYLGKGIIQPDLECTLCLSKNPIIRVPLAFPLPLAVLLIDYPDFEGIRGEFKKYYSFSHTLGIWEPYSHLEFELAQKYFNFDGGVIVLGRSRKEETAAKDKEALLTAKIEKENRKALKKERRMHKVQEKK